MPARLKRIIRALRNQGCEVKKPKKGSHYKAIRLSDGKTYPIPAHNGPKSEISDCYIDGVIESLGLDGDQFRDDL